jgi:AraC-like DNA-binding protein
VDPLTGFLDGPRARNAFVLRAVMEPPWSIRVQGEAPLSIVVMAAGTAWIVGDDGVAQHLRGGDVAVVRGPDPYTFADDPSTAPMVVIHPGQRCTTVAGDPVHETMGLGVRTWGNRAGGSDMMLVGTYEQRSQISERLLAALPPVLVLDSAEVEVPLVGFMADQIARDEPGQEVVLDRLLDLVLIAVLRAWFARPEADPPAWYRAHGDPLVGRALRLIQDAPDRPWTIASLAAEVGSSRAALARRFTELVGQPPMAYLTEWRLALAADLLLEPGATIGSVASRVGYGSPFALSAAFKRVRGVSPRDHRARAA